MCVWMKWFRIRVKDFVIVIDCVYIVDVEFMIIKEIKV